MTKVYAEVYGCPSNIADSEIAIGLLKKAGFEIVDSIEESDLNIIFTCVVKTPTEQRMIGRIQQLAADKPLIVAGCMPKVERRKIEKLAAEASMLGPDSIQAIVDVAKKTLKGEKIIFVKDLQKPKLCLPRIRKNKNVGIVEISNGCLSSCTYCIVKFARGRLRSYPIEKIIEEVRAAVANGCREIWLTSQDNGCYGLDIGTNLAKLLKAVCGIPGNYTIRVGMMNPTYVKKILNELIEVYKNEKIQKFLHLPVQSGSDKILRAMKRGYTVVDFVEIVERFRKEIPDLFLSTDVIVGFPDESDADFDATIKLLKKIKPDKVNISKFGARPGTEAAKLKQLPIEVINERSRRLYKIIKEF